MAAPTLWSKASSKCSLHADLGRVSWDRQRNIRNKLETAWPWDSGVAGISRIACVPPSCGVHQEIGHGPFIPPQHSLTPVSTAEHQPQSAADRLSADPALCGSFWLGVAEHPPFNWLKPLLGRYYSVPVTSHFFCVSLHFTTRSMSLRTSASSLSTRPAPARVCKHPNPPFNAEMAEAELSRKKA